VRDESRDDVECTYIYSIEQSLQPGDMENAEEELSPMWLIIADTGRFLIDETTGEIVLG
jgi:hypothetical protein